MQQEQQQQELPEEALNRVLQATITDARYLRKQDMSAITISVEYGGRLYKVRKNLWAGRGGEFRQHDRHIVSMCNASGLDFDTFARTAPERLDLAHRKYTLSVSVHRTESGKLWPEIVSYSMREEGKERSKEEILEDVTIQLNRRIADLELSLCTLADTQQKAESETRRLRKAYDELSAEYRSVVFERDDLRRRLGMEPGRSILPDNILDISSADPDRFRRRRPSEDEDQVTDSDIMDAFLHGQI